MHADTHTDGRTDRKENNTSSANAGGNIYKNVQFSAVWCSIQLWGWLHFVCNVYHGESPDRLLRWATYFCYRNRLYWWVTHFCLENGLLWHVTHFCLRIISLDKLQIYPRNTCVHTLDDWYIFVTGIDSFDEWHMSVTGIVSLRKKFGTYLGSQHVKWVY